MLSFVVSYDPFYGLNSGLNDIICVRFFKHHKQHMTSLEIFIKKHRAIIQKLVFFKKLGIIKFYYFSRLEIFNNVFFSLNRVWFRYLRLENLFFGLNCLKSFCFFRFFLGLFKNRRFLLEESGFDWLIIRFLCHTNIPKQPAYLLNFNFLDFILSSSV